MNTINIYLLFTLLICHWAADFTQLSRPKMLAAKRFGKPNWPIFQHALIHGILMLISICIYTGEFARFDWVWTKADDCFVVIVLSHFLIDVWKGRMNRWFHSLTNPANVYHWWIFGFDQLLHTSVIIWVTVYIS